MNDSILIGYKVDPFPYEVNFIDLPPADPICFKMASTKTTSSYYSYLHDVLDTNIHFREIY